MSDARVTVTAEPRRFSVSARRRLASLVLPGLLLPLLAGVPAAATADEPTADEPTAWTVPSYDALRAAPGGADLSPGDGAVRSSSTPSGRGPDPAAGQRAGYLDTCRDASGSPLDLRELTFSDDGAGTYSLTVTSCTPWTAADVAGRGHGIDIPLAVPGGRGGADYVLVLEVGSDGQLALTTYRTPSHDPAEARATDGPRPVTWSKDGHTARAQFPQSALGGAAEFAFLASSKDAEGRLDYLPEDYADALAYPFSCAVSTARAATVLVEPGASESVQAELRARGTAVRAAHPSVLSVPDVSDAALGDLRRTPGVRSAERAAVYRRLREPADIAYPVQWSLHDPAGGIRAPEGWDVRTGSGAILAVIDDGVDGVRPDLAGRVIEGRDTVPYRRLQGAPLVLPAGSDSDLGGHGTAVSGLAAANAVAAEDSDGQARTGIAGVDWSASVLPYRVFDAAGCATDAAVVAALRDAADRGASVVNLSLGGPSDSPALREAVAEVTARGVLVVAASGNARETAPDQISYPAGYDQVVAVAASLRDRSLARYSSGGAHVDIAAPGGAATGSPETDLLVLGERGSLDALAGTSFAAPLVSGAALLFRAAHPGQSPAQVATALRRSAGDAGEPGPDPDFGAGILDLGALLRLPVARPRSTERACPPGQVPASTFNDVPPDSVHRPSIDCIAWWEISNGANGGYQPFEQVTRSQMAAFLARIIERSGGTLPPEPRDFFADDDASVHQLRINQLAELGVVSGLGEGRYGPREPVDRGQMATFLTRAYEQRTGVPLQADGDYFGDDNGTTHEQRTNAAAAAGFTGGLGDGGYGPTVTVRRDAMATFLARVLDRLVADGQARPPSG